MRFHHCALPGVNNPAGECHIYTLLQRSLPDWEWEERATRRHPQVRSALEPASAHQHDQLHPFGISRDLPSSPDASSPRARPSPARVAW